ncbi:hypothetical protein GCM10025865_17570 [Paraoerskovia sediminicola]|uniref:Uncharacterized protein n=1 Tax=Paraoerskovia sediminicola TaxID=1138587 RepID=A0ABN6XG42_9CELL|nr:hypothetical protein [Paraoerskovia sediminicola]BDZ42458.1 hypothetical protein GCM10025865_17570 [Paraoerskovia sediminicola]
MRLMQIEPGAIGAWEIETFMSGAYRLSIPADGRPSVVELAMPGEEQGAEAVGLLAWGRFDELTGLGAGVVVGESMLLVLNQREASGDYTTRITTKVVHILEDREVG